MLELISYILVIVFILILGTFVFTRNPKSSTNQSFAFFSLVVSSWISANYFSNQGAIEIRLFANRFAYTAAMLSILGLLLFATSFPLKASKNRMTRVLIYSAPFFFLLSFTSYVVKDYTEKPNQGVTEIVSGPLFAPYIFYILLLFSSVIYYFVKSYRISNPLTRTRVRLVGMGIASSFVWVLISSVVIPSLTGNWQVSKMGPVGLIIMVAAIAYAIIRHKLFDIRLVVARTFGYLLSVSALAVLYGLISFGVINILLPDNASINTQRITYTILAVVLAFTFQPFKRFFDRWSNKLFYRDAYDSQELLNNLNSVLVGNIELEKLLTSSSQIINTTIKSEFCVFGIKAEGKSPQRILGTVDKQFTSTDIAEVRKITPSLKVKTIITDELDESQARLREVLRKNDIAILVRLTDTPNKNQEGIGYMVLGAKKSGSPYSQQDIRILEIIGDELVIAVQNALRFEEIQNFNITLQDKVDDATKQLRKANQRLIELDQTKDDFISMASHQLRTPLTSVKGYISMVMEGDAGKVSKKQNELLDQAFVSAQRMVYLIADLLNVSRLRTGKFIIEPKETNLADVIEGEISQLIETAKGRNLELTYDKPKNFPHLMLDETKIRQVIMNFADNAIYYTPSGGRIQVALEDKGQSIEFTVTDDGIGVPKNEQHHLFNKFYRAGNAKKARPDGTGLGLFMAKKVVAAQGGSIIFKSQENKGSVFGFSFAKQRLLPENYKGIAKSPESNPL
jgi:signal transduction histidine kinase